MDIGAKLTRKMIKTDRRRVRGTEDGEVHKRENTQNIRYSHMRIPFKAHCYTQIIHANKNYHTANGSA